MNSSPTTATLNPSTLHSPLWRCIVVRVTTRDYETARFHIVPVAPVAYQVIFGPGIGQFREFEPPRVQIRIYSQGLFLVHIPGIIDLMRKARERDLATLDENSTSSGIAEPYAR